MREVLYVLGTTTLLLFVSFLIASALPLPHALYGMAYDTTGNPIQNVDMVLTNGRTNAELHIKTNVYGEYQTDAYNFVDSYRDRDIIYYYVNYEDHKLYDTAIIDIKKGGTKLDFTFPFSLGLVTPNGSYPSVAGTHTGTITPNTNIVVNRLETRACEGTGGHTKSIKITNSKDIWEATWNGYKGDYGTLEFNTQFTLEKDTVYDYTIVTGSYPQIIHMDRLEVPAGVITCDSFVDANGASYWNWIPSIRLGVNI